MQVNVDAVEERSAANKDGRVYVVALRVRDAPSNVTWVVFKVTVSKNQSGAAAVDDGPAFTVMSSCP